MVYVRHAHVGFWILGHNPHLSGAEALVPECQSTSSTLILHHCYFSTLTLSRFWATLDCARSYRLMREMI